MGTLDWLSEIIKNLFGISGNGWVKRESASSLDLETCNGVAQSDDATRTCAICVALNNTIFKNDNKPNYYHIKCKCVNVPTELQNIILDFPMQKITHYLFKDVNKLAMMKLMGYHINDANQIYDFVANAVKNGFKNGCYSLRVLNINGQHIQIDFIIPGKNNHIHETFKCHCGCVVWPNGKIKVATPLIKD